MSAGMRARPGCARSARRWHKRTAAMDGVSLTTLGTFPFVRRSMSQRPEHIRGQIAWRPLNKTKTSPIILQIELVETGGTFMFTFTPEEWSKLLLSNRWAEGTMGPYEAIVDTPKGKAV